MSPETAERAPIALDVQMIPIDKLLNSPMNTRRHYEPTGMAELEASIRQVGVLTPLIARLYPLALPGDPFFELAAGHRRFRAASAAGVREVPVRVMDLDDAAFRHVLIVENLQRQDIHPLDEADGYQALMKADKAYTVEAIAAKVGKSPSYVYQRLKLTNLIPDAREAWDADEITAAHAAKLARLTAPQQAKALIECWHPLFGKAEGAPKAEPAPLSQLDRWIERHVQIQPAAPETAYFFPEVAQQLAAEEQPEKLLQLSESHMPGADLGTKKHGILGQGRWTRITGKSNRCANLEKGVVVHGGPMRVIEVCATKGCPKHFPERKKAKAAAGGRQQENYQDRYKREDEERRRRAQAWEVVLPKVQERLLTSIVKLGPTGRVLDIALGELRSELNHRQHDVFNQVVGTVTAENFILATVAVAVMYPWGIDEAKRDAKRLGVDIGDLETEFKRAAAPPKVEKPKAATKKGGKAAKKR